MTGPTSNSTGSAQIIADSLMPKRAAFIKWANGRGLDTAEDVDTWGQRKFAHPHIESMWTGWFNAHAPAADETTLPDLARLLGTASKEGKAVKLSAIAAGTLYNAMTCGSAMPATPKLPTTPEEVVAFIDGQFESMDTTGAIEDRRITLTVHDLLSAFQNLADFAEVAAQPLVVQQHAAVVYPPDGTVSPFTVINLGAGMVKIGDALHDGRLPALWFGKDGLGMGVEQVMNRAARPDETLAVITFANVEGLDVLLEVVQRIRGIAFPGAQADGSAM